MRKQLCKTTAVCFCAAGMAFGQAFLTWGAWQRNGMQWQYCAEEGGEVLRSVWRQIDGAWYRFGDDGVMKTGWHLDADGRWYFLNPASDETEGRMMTGWQWIDGFCYYFSEGTDRSHPLGSMYAHETTPDHYQVDESGAWTDQEGNPVHSPDRGIRTKTAAKAGEGQTGKTGPGGEGGRSPGRQGNGGGGSGRPGSGSHAVGGDKTVSGDGDRKNPGSGSVGGTGSSGAETEGGTGTGGEGEPGVPETEGGRTEERVNWQVHFTDLETHQTCFLPSRSGIIDDGGILTIYFQTQITDSQGYIWKSKQQSPYLVTITGPQSRIIYVEYIRLEVLEQEPDPWQEERKILEECFDAAREEEGAFRGVRPEDIPDSAFLVTDRAGCSLRLKSAASRLLPGQEETFYVIGKNYTPEGTMLAEDWGGEVVYSHTTERRVLLEDDLYTIVRFRIQKLPEEEAEDSVWSEREKRHWNTGDIQERTLGGITYRFRCIDQNYGDETDRGRQKALFLCDTVIPADTGSEYVYEKREDGTYGYQFCPGPLASFGDTGSYKASRIRTWFETCREEFGETEKIPTGEEYAYEGSTVPGSCSQLEAQELRPVYIGRQSLWDNLFLLSVDEALRYRRWLWRFEGSEEENPESQWGAFCESYWLRTPGQEKTEDGKDMVYVVDLVQGNIRPQTVEIKGDPDDEELAMTGTTGVRPAFVVRQY